MPNGHGMLLGCFVCTHCSEKQTMEIHRHCQLHDIDVRMNLACADFDNSVNDVTLHPPVVEGTVYIYLEIAGYGYPPPLEFVSLAQITDYKDMDQEQRNQARAEAQKRANKQFEERQK